MPFEDGNKLGLKHGHGTRAGKSREYQSWTNMITRCKSDPKYTEKNIIVCDRWKSFPNFLSDMGPRPVGTSLDRIRGHLGYFPGNCRWATPSEQRMNQHAPRGNRARYHPLPQSRFTLIYWLKQMGLRQQDISEVLDIPINIVGRIWRRERLV